MTDRDHTTARAPADCSYRRSDGGDGAACGLVQMLLQRPAAECGVNDEVCLACCRSFPPTPQNPNPVVTSHLVATAARAIERLDSCDPQRERLRELWRRGVEQLPSDLDLERHAQTQRHLRDGAAAGQIDLQIPIPEKRRGPVVRSWAVGVTTAPRREPTLAQTLDSLAKAGWDEPHLFLDGEVTVPPRNTAGGITRRDPAVGAWPNYYLSLSELLLRYPHADAYLMLQDDVCVYPHPSVRSYLERIMWPGTGPGIVSLYCSKEYTTEQAGWTAFPGTWLWGALAFVFSRDAALKFLSHPLVVHHRWNRHPGGLAHIDWLIGQWVSRENLTIWFPTPSIVQHIGRTSAIWKAAPFAGERMASRFLGDPES